MSGWTFYFFEKWGGGGGGYLYNVKEGGEGFRYENYTIPEVPFIVPQCDTNPNHTVWSGLSNFSINGPGLFLPVVYFQIETLWGRIVQIESVY